MRRELYGSALECLLIAKRLLATTCEAERETLEKQVLAATGKTSTTRSYPRKYPHDAARSAYVTPYDRQRDHPVQLLDSYDGRNGFLSLGGLPCIGGPGGTNMSLGHSSQSE